MKNYLKKYIKQILLSFTVFSLLLIPWYMLYSFQREKQNILIDAYNFEQLEKVKQIMKSSNDKYKFRNLTEFNKFFLSNILPKENCYYVWSYNWPEKYILPIQDMQFPKLFSVLDIVMITILRILNISYLILVRIRYDNFKQQSIYLLYKLHL